MTRHDENYRLMFLGLWLAMCLAMALVWFLCLYGKELFSECPREQTQQERAEKEKKHKSAKGI